MAQTMTTTRDEELPDFLERLARRWKGVMLEITMRPQGTGYTVLTMTWPTGVEQPPDPGVGPWVVLAAELREEVVLLAERLRAMTVARDASDAEAQELRARSQQ